MQGQRFDADWMWGGGGTSRGRRRNHVRTQGKEDRNWARTFFACNGRQRSPRTIRLLGQINKKPVSILLNTGSTHNFIDARVVQRIGPPIWLEPSFKVTIAGGDKLQSKGVRKSVWIKCQGIWNWLSCLINRRLFWLAANSRWVSQFQESKGRITQGRTWELNGARSNAIEVVTAQLMDSQSAKRWVLYVWIKEDGLS